MEEQENTIQKVKSMMFDLLIHRQSIEDIVLVIDESIMNDIWHDDFEFLMKPDYYQTENVERYLFHEDEYPQSKTIFEKKEQELFPELYQKLVSEQESWQNVQKVLVALFNLERRIMKLTSNQIPKIRMKVVDDFYLRKEDLSPLLSMPDTLVQFLGTSSNIVDRIN